MAAAITETAKRAGAEAYCRKMGIRVSVFLEDLDCEAEAPRYPDAGELWACDTLEALQAHVQEKTQGQPVTFSQQAQMAYLEAVRAAMGAPTATVTPATTHPHRRPARPQTAIAGR